MAEADPQDRDLAAHQESGRLDGGGQHLWVAGPVADDDARALPRQTADIVIPWRDRDLGTHADQHADLVVLLAAIDHKNGDTPLAEAGDLPRGYLVHQITLIRIDEIRGG